jgi:hypothetical protein
MASASNRGQGARSRQPAESERRVHFSRDSGGEENDGYQGSRRVSRNRDAMAPCPSPPPRPRANKRTTRVTSSRSRSPAKQRYDELLY